jgi:opacity protein-like surface antigen
MKKNKVLLTCLAGLLLAQTSLASDDSVYVRLDAGLSMAGKLSKRDYDQFGTRSLKNAGVYSLGLGYKINDNFRADVAAEYRGKYKFTKGKVPVFNATPALVDGVAAQNFNSFAIKLNGYYDVAKLGAFTPYVTAGAGIAFNNAGDLTMVEKASGKLTNVQKGQRSSSFTWNIGGGARIDIAEDVGVDIGYKYVDLGSVKTSNKFITHSLLTGFDTPSSQDPAKSRLKAHEVTIGLFYKF